MLEARAENKEIKRRIIEGDEVYISAVIKTKHGKEIKGKCYMLLEPEWEQIINDMGLTLTDIQNPKEFFKNIQLARHVVARTFRADKDGEMYEPDWFRDNVPSMLTMWLFTRIMNMSGMTADAQAKVNLFRP